MIDRVGKQERVSQGPAWNVSARVGYDLDSSGAADTSAHVVAARAAVVNRTRRVVRERATDLRSHRSRVRSLSVPLCLCGSLVIILCTAIWSLLSQYEASATGIPDASNQLVVMLLWFLPALATILALVFLRRAPEDVS